MSYPIRDIDGVDEQRAELLKAVGIRTTAAFLEAAKDMKGRKALAARTGLNEKLLLKWANMADRMRVRGVGKEYAELVRLAGVDTIRELKHRNAKRLFRAIEEANKRRKLVQFLPSEKVVGRWIEEAKALDIKISY
jgi:hypothetical protein